jgi:hypothetical protein
MVSVYEDRIARRDEGPSGIRHNVQVLRHRLSAGPTDRGASGHEKWASWRKSSPSRTFTHVRVSRGMHPDDRDRCGATSSVTEGG